VSAKSSFTLCYPAFYDRGVKKCNDLFFFTELLLLFWESVCYGQTDDIDKQGRIIRDYDACYTMWDVYVPDPQLTDYHDYDIDPTFVNGISLSASSSKIGSGEFQLLAAIYWDYAKEKDDLASEDICFIKELSSYDFFNSRPILTQFQYADFECELVGQYRFETDRIKDDLLSMLPKLFILLTKHKSISFSF